MARVKRPAEEIVTAIADKSKMVRQSAARLDERIEKFIVFLNTLKGRVEGKCYGDHPDVTSAFEKANVSLVLWFHRTDTKDWTISWTTYDLQLEHHEDYSPEFKSLRTAPMKIKISAVKMFPDLLNAIEGAQNVLINDLDESCELFDGMMAGLKLPTTLTEGK